MFTEIETAAVAYPAAYGNSHYMTCAGRRRYRFFASSAATMNTQSSSFLGHRGTNKAPVDCQVDRRCTFQLYFIHSDGDHGELVSDGDGCHHPRLRAAGRGGHSRKETLRMSNRQHLGCHLPTWCQDGISVAARNAPHIHQ